jgi:RND family efflux transporter MFP subunit
VNSVIIAAPQVPTLQIVTIAESGRPIRKGEVVVEFDAAAQEQSLLERNTTVRTVDSEIVQSQASHKIVDEADSMNLMTAQYNLERAKLDASKAEVVSAIEGAKSRIDVGISQGELGQVNTVIDAHKTTQQADIDRLRQRKDKTLRDVERAKGYLSKMVLRAPQDGIVNILPNFRASGSFGSSPPPFKEGDRVWTGAALAEIPDLSNMRIELKLDEVDRGRLQIGQPVRIRVDAVADRELKAELDWISPIASVNFQRFGLSEKTFPARATMKELDPRLRPGMSATAEVVIESQPGTLLIPVRASFMHQGKPAVYVQRGKDFVIRQIEVGKRNDTDMVVLSGLKEGEVVALENPVEAAKRAKKL